MKSGFSGDLAILTRCDVLVLVPGAPGASAGTRMEVAAALGLGLPVVRWPDGEEVLRRMVGSIPSRTQ